MMNKLKVLLVEDEESSREELKHLIFQEGTMEVAGEAETVAEAIELLNSSQFDVVFLDIKMPGISGLELAGILKKMAHPPAVVFITAYSEHALKAFDLEAVDYLMKPVSEERFGDTVTRLKKRFDLPEKEQREEKKYPETLERLFIEKEGGKRVPVLPEEIFFLEARDDYAMLHTVDQRFLISGSLKRLEERLSKYGFFRAHRKYLVNLNKISEIIPLSRGVILLRMADLAKSEILVSRRKAKLLRRVLKF